MAEGFPQVQEQTPHQRRRKLSKDPRPVMAAYPTITDLSRVRGEGSSFQVEGSVPKAHRVHGPPGPTTDGQARWAAVPRDSRHGSTRGITFTGCDSNRSVRGKPPRFGGMRGKGTVGWKSGPLGSTAFCLQVTKRFSRVER